MVRVAKGSIDALSMAAFSRSRNPRFATARESVSGANFEV